MSVLALPKSSPLFVALAALALPATAIAVFAHGHVQWWALFIALPLSAFISDLVTGIAHFCFDYVFAYKTPVLGPIAREFTHHHEQPALDPSTRMENLTKGAYASLPMSLSTLGLAIWQPPGSVSSTLVLTLLFMTAWALFFHQIHSYAHMGRHIPPDRFRKITEEIALLPTKAEQLAAFRRVFDSAPIPKPIRRLQKMRILLQPERHNIHHLGFETDFSSVNGWSDPLLNLFVRKMAVRYKSDAHRAR